MAVYFPVPVTPSGRHDNQHNPHPQWPSPSAFSGLVSYGGQHLNSHPTYHSPSSHSQPVPIRPQSASGPQPLTHHWQQQLIKYEASRSASLPHHRARTSALTMRNAAKQVITITNPNLAPQHKQQGSISERTDTASSVAGDNEPPRQGTPSTSDHPSASIAPVATSPPVAPRPTLSRPKDEAGWTTLDMGGMRLKNLAPSLFKLNYLTTLYVNHNNLTKLSPAISQLRNLILLDLSSNQLAAVPPEIGMCTSLRELLLFDNRLETLPTQMGTLHQLVMLGIEGNPMAPHLREMLQKEGTPALIAYLRDAAPIGPNPPERQWQSISPPTQRMLENEDEPFKVVSYNILCERCATTTMYGYTPGWALQWDYRKNTIMNELKTFDADILCLQEVDISQYEEFFSPQLEALGYTGIFSPKSRAKTMSEAQRRLVDGCAIFFRSEQFALVEHQLIEFNSASLRMNNASHKFNGTGEEGHVRATNSVSDDMYNRVFTKDNIAIYALLESRLTGAKLIVVNVHVYWDPAFNDVKLIQTCIMMEELEKIGKRFATLPPRLLDGSHDGTKGKVHGTRTNGFENGSEGSSGESSDIEQSPEDSPAEPPAPRFAPRYDNFAQIPTIVCGDFNSITSEGVYEFLATGALSPTHRDFLGHTYGRYTDVDGGGLKHSYNLKNAYATVLGGQELPLTNYTPSFKGAIDHIWYSHQSLAVESVLGPVSESYLDKVVGFPNPHYPSDHVSISGQFRILPPKKDVKQIDLNAPRPAAFYNGKGRR